jgi:hypothetical protein
VVGVEVGEGGERGVHALHGAAIVLVAEHVVADGAEVCAIFPR